jgi:hypothetical protein
MKDLAWASARGSLNLLPATCGLRVLSLPYYAKFRTGNVQVNWSVMHGNTAFFNPGQDHSFSRAKRNRAPPINFN